ncbi:hypothetical protein ACWC10_22670 [Streptomyces sp. NPDC001595]|uniref:hypothetical protein n=1 Tax=Streptomyces sp. NPDC001532 TaxID=3154520 RepID=UPI00332C940B
MKAALRLRTGWVALLLLLVPVLGIGTAHEADARTLAEVTAPADAAPSAARQAGTAIDSDTPWGP